MVNSIIQTYPVLSLIAVAVAGDLKHLHVCRQRYEPRCLQELRLRRRLRPRRRRPHRRPLLRILPPPEKPPDQFPENGRNFPAEKSGPVSFFYSAVATRVIGLF